MTLSGTSDLFVVELVLYLLIFPIALYLAYRHGSSGALGYFYLNISCGVRIAADVVSLLPANRDATHPTMATAILSSIGLSPLLLALSGFLHESHMRLVEITQGASQVRSKKRWMWAAQFQIHGVSILGMVLAIVGNVKLASGNGLSSSEINDDEKIRSAGAVILLVLWAILAQYALYLCYVARKVHVNSSGAIDLQRMVMWIVFAMPFAGLRCVSAMLYTFDHKDTNLNPVIGALWVKVIFVVLASLGAILSLCISGWVSRNAHNSKGLISEGHQRRLDSSSAEVQYEAVRSTKH